MQEEALTQFDDLLKQEDLFKEDIFQMWFIPNAISGIYATMGEKEKALKTLKDYKS